MSIDYWEAQREEFIDSLASELYQEHKERAVDEFIDERLKSYYRDNAGRAIQAMGFIQRSKELLGLDPTASLFYSSVATEVVLKSIAVGPGLTCNIG